eukprot:scaffold2700_cov388-Prasinococcus_capsulatus_cf.AAC.2
MMQNVGGQPHDLDVASVDTQYPQAFKFTVVKVVLPLFGAAHQDPLERFLSAFGMSTFILPASVFQDCYTWARKHAPRFEDLDDSEICKLPVWEPELQDCCVGRFFAHVTSDSVQRKVYYLMMDNGTLVDIDFIGDAGQLAETWQILGKLRNIEPTPILEEDTGSGCIHGVFMKPGRNGSCAHPLTTSRAPLHIHSSLECDAQTVSTDACPFGIAAVDLLGHTREPANFTISSGVVRMVCEFYQQDYACFDFPIPASCADLFKGPGALP